MRKSGLPGLIEQRVDLLLRTPVRADTPRWRRGGLRALQLFYAVVRDVLEGQLTLRAMSLVYTTLLSLVPLLALSFSILKGFGVHNQIRPTLLTFLQPLGADGERLAGQIIGFVENMKVGVLGALGLGLLVYTVISLLQKIEATFNYVWHVRQVRPFAQRFSQYLSVLTVGPILVFAALGVTAALFDNRLVQALATIEPFGSLVAGLAWVLPYAFMAAAFTFIYAYMPNTRVRLGPALTGGVVAALLWQGAGWGFTTFVAGSAKYTAVYAGFAIVILAMIWLYLCWLIVLVGASLAFYCQNPLYVAAPGRHLELSIRDKEALSLRALTRIARSFREAEPPWAVASLAEQLATPTEPVAEIVGAFVRSGLLAETTDDPPCYVPARALHSVTIRELLTTIRGADGETARETEAKLRDPGVYDVLEQIEAAAGDFLGDSSLDDLVSDRDDRRPT